MARAKRSSSVLETARQRLAGLKSTKTTPDFGPALTPAAYEKKVTDFSTRLDGYNQKLASIDDEQNGVDADESELREWNKRILSATEAQFGPNSSEYELVGGTRQSERKRPTRKGPGSGGTPPKP